MKTLIILPTYNEKENLEKLAGEILKLKCHSERSEESRKNSGRDPSPRTVMDAGFRMTECDILVIDDNSPDGTGEIADNLAAKDKRLRVIHRRGKLGLGTAYYAGFQYGFKNNYDLIMTMDCDFSHPPKYLPEIIKNAANNDLVIGSRYVHGGGIEGWPIHRKILSSAANFLVHSFLRLNARDCTSGLRCYRRELLKRLPLDKIKSSGYSYLVEILFYAQNTGAKIKEIPFVFADRVAGASKISKKEIFNSIKTIIRLLG